MEVIASVTSNAGSVNLYINNFTDKGIGFQYTAYSHDGKCMFLLGTYTQLQNSEFTIVCNIVHFMCTRECHIVFTF